MLDCEDIYSAAATFRDTCLLADGSVLSEGQLWTAANGAELVAEFIDQPDEGDRTFEEKLRDQLDSASSGAKQLAAEMLWLMMLFPSNYRQATKRDLVQRVWQWSGATLDPTHKALAPFVHGIGSGGPGYNNFRPFELMLVIRFTVAWKALSGAEQSRLLGDGWQFAAWFDTLPDAQSRQFRHMLLHLLFPTEFERCSSANDKRRIERAFLPLVAAAGTLGKSDTPFERDRRLKAIRLALQAQHPGKEIDFYTTPEVREKWDPEAAQALVKEEGPGYEVAPLVSSHRVWLIGAGEGGTLWPDFRDRGEITIGWEELGDLSQYPSLEAVRLAMGKVYDNHNSINNALACDEFAREMKIGDEVYVKQGWHRILAHGTVTGDYTHDPKRAEQCNVRKVRWDKVHDWRLSAAFRLPTKTLTDITTYTPLLAFLREQGTVEGISPPPRRPYGADDIMRDAFLPRDSVQAILASLERRKNIILQGPPGVGKSFLARRIAYALIGEEAPSNVESVQFHQSYAYDDFMQGWRPGNGSFELRDGVFHRFCRNAQGVPDEKFVFIIDEINRGNLSKIFGELMFLVEADKRGPAHALTLTNGSRPGDAFFVPENVYLVGLMNTADRSLAMVDYALRRRFAFHDLRPALDSAAFAAHLQSKGVDAGTLGRIRENVARVNKEILDDHKNLGAGYAIGHSYFCPLAAVPDPGAWYEQVVREELVPLLTEYWFDDPVRVKRCTDLLLA